MSFPVFAIILCYTTGTSLALDATWWNRHAASISCSRPGYFVNSEDCHSFYRCVDRSTWDKPALQRYDFTCPRGMVFDPAVSVCTEPGSNGCADPWWPGSSGGSNAAGNSLENDNAPNPSTSSNSLDSLPPIFESSRGPENSNRRNGGGAWFDRSSSSGSVEKDDFPSSLSSEGSSSNRGRPAFSTDFNFGTGNSDGRDPLDDEFDSDPNPPTFSGGSGSTESSKDINDDLGSLGGSDSSRKCEPFCNTEEDKSNSGEGSRSSNQKQNNAQRDWFNRPSKSDWNKNKGGGSKSNELDLWGGDNNFVPGNNKRPSSSANWGGASRPSSPVEESSWKPITPWGSSNNGDRNTPDIPPRRNDSSWWDPPYPAMPYQPLSRVGPPPPPEPWANPFRPRYPVYQIVAYPTYPYNHRRPVFVIYSNSKK